MLLSMFLVQEKLRAMGVPVEGYDYIYGDNKLVLANTKTPHFQLKKKSNNVAYHYYQESSALYEFWTTYVDTHNNLSDLLTNNFSTGE